jgi:MarR family transcriptional regulator, organic hydroperoxide resistance regulator
MDLRLPAPRDRRMPVATSDWDDYVRAAKLCRIAWDGIMKEHGGHGGQNLLLRALWERDGLTPIDVARRLDIAAPTVVKMASRMVTSGLITRRRDSRDRRRVHLYLTDRGRAMRKPIEEAERRFWRMTCAGLTADERRFMASALTKIIRNMQAHSAKRYRRDLGR